MNIDIKNILATGERVTLECKKAQNSVPNSLWDTYSAFDVIKAKYMHCSNLGENLR